MKKIVPKFKKKNVAVVFSANEYFAPFMAAAIQSVIDTSSNQYNYDINILHANIERKTQKLIESMVNDKKNISIRFIMVSEYIDLTRLYTENRETITVETYFRLLIPDLFEDYKKVLYLDADMIIKRDIAELYNEKLDGYMLASSRDLWGIANYYLENDQTLNYRKSIGLSNLNDYFIAGMLLFNIPEIRKKYTVEYMLNLAYSRKWVQHDQDVMNVLFENHTKLLSVKWDFMYGYSNITSLPEDLYNEYLEAYDDHYITHYGTNRKPWIRAYYHEYMEFWKAAVKTPFFEHIFSCIKKNNDYKVHLIEKLFNCKPNLVWENDIPFLKYKDLININLSNIHSNIHIISIRDGSLIIEGDSPLYGIEDNKYEIFVKVGNKKFFSEKISGDSNKYLEDDLIFYSNRFKFVIPLKNLNKNGLRIRFFCKYQEKEFKKTILKFKHNCPFNENNPRGYYFKDGYILTGDSKTMLIRKSTKFLHFRKELVFDLSLVKKRNFSAIGYRFLYFICKPFIKKKIWIFSDRTNKADDNGEALFDYVNSLNEKNISTYFVLRKDSDDFARIGDKGKVLSYLSLRHRLKHLLCEMNISSQADMPVIYPFSDSQKEGLRDLLMKPKYIFLQHGIINSDISRWFNYYNLKYSIFCTSSKKEYTAVLNNYRYNVNDSILKLTGLARHDKLYHDEKKVITIMPTWRKQYSTRSDEDKGVWKPKKNFVYSDYYKFYNSLINDYKLIDAAKKYGYKINFFPHPNVMSAIDLFEKNEYVNFCTPTTRYSKIFSESMLVVTDYSSAVMDFTYLRKPVVYCQFDQDTFFNGKNISVDRSFNHEKQGFGEVEKSLDDTVKRIIEYMKNDCKLKEKYRRKIDKFYEFNDKNNCKRVYEEIKKLK